MTKEKRIIISSECGVLKLPVESIVEKGRLSPGSLGFFVPPKKAGRFFFFVRTLFVEAF